MCAVRFHKDYGESEFAYQTVTKAWQAINGNHSSGRYFFIARLEKPLSNGEWMAFLRLPDKNKFDYLDVPFDYDGFHESGDAKAAIFGRAYEGLGWRIREMNANMLPEIVDKNLRILL